MYLCLGEEMLADEDTVVASRAASQGVTVVFEKYEAMPHCFAMLLPALTTSERCMRSWGGFCSQTVEDPLSVKADSKLIHTKTGKEDDVQLDSVTTITFDEAKKLMAQAKQRRMKAFDNAETAMPKSSL